MTDDIKKPDEQTASAEAASADQHPLSDTNKQQVAAAATNGQSISSETKEQVLAEQAAAMHDPVPEPEIEPAGEVTVEDAEEVEVEDLAEDGPFLATPHALLADSFDLITPRLKLNIIIPLVDGLLEDDKEYVVADEDSGEITMFNTLATPKPEKPLGVAYDALSGLLESLTNFNSQEFYVVADQLHLESALNLIASNLPEQFDLNLPLEVEQIAEATGVAPILTGSPTLDGDGVVFNFVIPYPVLINRSAEAGLLKVIKLISAIVNKTAKDGSDLYDVDADLMFAVNPADFAYQPNLAGLVTALVENNFVQTTFTELHEELTAFIEDEALVEDIMDGDLDDYDIDEDDDLDDEEIADEIDADEVDEAEDDDDMADEMEDEDEPQALLDSFSAPDHLEALAEALDGSGLAEPTTLLYIRPL